MHVVLLLWSVLSPDGRVMAETRGPAVVLDGKTAWSGRAVTSSLVWSPRGDALGFTARDRSGQGVLVVLIAPQGATPAILSWPIPRSAEPARAVTWLGPTRVGAGPSELAPRVIASFSYDSYLAPMWIPPRNFSASGSGASVVRTAPKR